MRNVITTDVLKTMIPDELEDYRAAGEDYRRELTHAVMRDLQSPAGWSANGEYRSEFGGFFPVQIRFTPSHERFDVAVSSPGELSSSWMVVFITRGGQPFSVVRTMTTFNPELINHTLSLIACLDADSYSFASIISTLAQEGAL
ncbi:conjugation system SOS inhibitor PsiB [Klebsiella michiganensis]|uniref:conjugation system SOS inhibitor PsiB n=1 Tax=Klebsiella michiganensis TaxID=1134687 RepID=UPI001CA55831|nr:conjugation system SOS inhibitor PsiB [Klebsiella michiganensis]MBW5995879.1 conjugation system SOS inhibitor PsiB [Klebsiella michiganensis]